MEFKPELFAIDVNGEAVGGIGLHPQTDIHRKNAELGYWLAEPFWGKGIVSKAILEIIEFGFKTYDIDRIFARPFGTNAASQKVLEKNVKQFQLQKFAQGVEIADSAKYNVQVHLNFPFKTFVILAK